MKNITFISFGSNSAFGGFAPGDTMRGVDDALADHLVDELKVAEYTATDAEDGAAPAKPARAAKPAKAT